MDNKISPLGVYAHACAVAVLTVGLAQRNGELIVIGLALAAAAALLLYGELF